MSRPHVPPDDPVSGRQNGASPITAQDEKTAMIGCAIGAAVISAVAGGQEVSRQAIIIELEKIRIQSSDLMMKIVCRDAAELLRKKP